MKFNFVPIFILLLLSVPSAAFNGDVALVNSIEWQDVYSISLYSALYGKETLFVPSEFNVDDVILTIPPKSITLFNSQDKAAIPGFSELLKGNGRTVLEVIEHSSKNYNLELGKRAFSEKIAKNVIITSSEIGHNAVSVMHSYASKNREEYSCMESCQVLLFLN